MPARKPVGSCCGQRRGANISRDASRNGPTGFPTALDQRNKGAVLGSHRPALRTQSRHRADPLGCGLDERLHRDGKCAGELRVMTSDCFDRLRIGGVCCSNNRAHV